MLQIYDSLTRSKRPFEPAVPGKVGLYVCGMTVYDYCHLGHARVLVCFDVIARYLRSQGFDVTYVRNITDIDDKIIDRARENGEAVDALTARFIEAFHEDQTALAVLAPDHEPRATRHIDTIIAMIEKLIENGAAYVADNGDVYYDVETFKSYGALSHKDIEGQQAGARIEIVSEKKNPLDFALWKKAKPEEPQWESPWGPGRPGWHIECSAMSTQCLGNHFDIHGGGFDLQFPHHENEIAQSEAATGETFVNTWMHVGYLQINREKMSKSLGNFFTIREVLEKYPAEVVRYFLLSSHYRSQLNYSEANLESAREALERFYQALRDLPEAEPLAESEYAEKFKAAMDDDFNTPQALAVLFELTHELNLNRRKDPARAAQLGATLKALAEPLGILQQAPAAFLQGEVAADVQHEIETLIAARNTARAEKDWAQADKLRDELKALGIEIEDTAQGTTWRRAT